MHAAPLLHTGLLPQEPPHLQQRPEDAALQALEQFRPPIQFAVYAACAGGDLLMAIEVPPDAVAAGPMERWRTRLDWRGHRLEPGNYLIELTVSGGAGSERKLLAIHVR